MAVEQKVSHGSSADPCREVTGSISNLSSGFPATRIYEAIRPIIEKWKLLIRGSVPNTFSLTCDAVSQVVVLTTDLPYAFRGAGGNQVVFLGRMERGTKPAVEEIIKTARATKTVAVLVGLTDEAAATAASLVPAGQSVILNAAQLREIFDSNFPKDVLRDLIIEQIPVERLVPFSTSSAAEGASFVGRANELKMLVFGEQDYALCGPGGMGKTSLLRQMQWTLRKNRDERHTRLVEVDLLGVSDLRDAVRRIAARIYPSRDAQDVTLSTLEPFLRRVRTGDTRFHDGPIDLVLDEMDSVLSADRRTFLKNVDSDIQQHVPRRPDPGDHPAHHLFRQSDYQINSRYPLMQVLRLSRTQGLVRLTISGRSETRTLLDDPVNPFVVDSQRANSSHSRLKLIDLGPLSTKESEEMLLAPLRDLKQLEGVDMRSILRRLADCKGIPFNIADLGLDLLNKQRDQVHNCE